MTPPALTPAARSSRKTSSRRAVREPSPAAKSRQAAAPRRFSGPVTGAAGTRRIATSPGTRRVSGPARPARSARPARPKIGTRSRRIGLPRIPHPAALRARSFALVRTLPDHAWLDRIVRGRAWIPILGVLLAGIVAMQVEVLKLSASTGRALQRGTALQSRNEQLRASVAVLSDDQRIERLAAGMGMVMPGPTTIRFLRPAGGVDLVRALNSIKAPNPTAFLGSLPAATTAAAGTAAIGTAATANPTGTSGATASPGATATGTAGTTSPTASSSGASSGAASTAGTPGVATPATSPNGSTSTAQGTPSSTPSSPGAAGSSTGAGGAAPASAGGGVPAAG